MIAIPSEPPTWRALLITADPTPALSTGTELIAAVVVGAIVMAIPSPPTRSPGKRFQKLELGSRVAKRSSEHVRRVIPTLINQRGPITSVNRPAIGATTMISPVSGRKVAPVLIGPYPRTFGGKSEL